MQENKVTLSIFLDYMQRDLSNSDVHISNIKYKCAEMSKKMVFQDFQKTVWVCKYTL